jgi:outer membrane protein assembly factor BamC
MENPNVTLAPPFRLLAMAAVATAALTACSSLSQLTGEETVDYRTQGNKTAPLDIPPDLTQLTRDPRYSPQGASISAVRSSRPMPRQRRRGAELRPGRRWR